MGLEYHIFQRNGKEVAGLYGQIPHLPFANLYCKYCAKYNVHIYDVQSVSYKVFTFSIVCARGCFDTIVGNHTSKDNDDQSKYANRVYDILGWDPPTFQEFIEAQIQNIKFK